MNHFIKSGWQKKVLRMPTAVLRRLLLICNHYVYSSREGPRVVPLGIIPKGVSRSKFCCSFPPGTFEPANMALCLQLLHGILSMTQTFSFAAAIVGDGITLLNGSIDIIRVT